MHPEASRSLIETSRRGFVTWLSIRQVYAPSTFATRSATRGDVARDTQDQPRSRTVGPRRRDHSVVRATVRRRLNVRTAGGLTRAK